MARLIDADFLKDVIEKRILAGLDESATEIRAIRMIVNVLDAAPTIKAEPVKRGEWSRPMEGKARLFQCNLCGGLTYTHGLATRKPYDFCPNCGARMEVSR